MKPIQSEGTVGILGGGQLGRMLALAAARLGLKAHIYGPEHDPAAGQVSAATTTADYGDEAALARFAAAVDVVTTEFENVPAQCARFLAQHRPVHPSAEALETAQDRVTEKAFLNGIGVETAPWSAIDSATELASALPGFTNGSILKTRRLGYDGKGQLRLSANSDPAAAIAEIGPAPAILEGMVAFECEISVIGVRAPDGDFRAYDPGENRHESGILRETQVPARVSAAVRDSAVAIARRIAEALDYAGVIGVEMFALADGRLLVNEIAPRVHNTGHWTIEGCAISQFENHIRAVCGLPLGTTERHSNAVMSNLLGDECLDWTGLLSDPAQALHLYGKGAPRPGRKMGHVTRLSRRTEA